MNFKSMVVIACILAVPLISEAQIKNYQGHSDTGAFVRTTDLNGAKVFNLYDDDYVVGDDEVYRKIIGYDFWLPMSGEKADDLKEYLTQIVLSEVDQKRIIYGKVVSEAQYESNAAGLKVFPGQSTMTEGDVENPSFSASTPQFDMGEIIGAPEISQFLRPLLSMKAISINDTFKKQYRGGMCELVFSLADNYILILLGEENDESFLSSTQKAEKKYQVIDKRFQDHEWGDENIYYNNHKNCMQEEGLLGPVYTINDHKE